MLLETTSDIVESTWCDLNASYFSLASTRPSSRMTAAIALYFHVTVIATQVAVRLHVFPPTRYKLSSNGGPSKLYLSPPSQARRI